jgi:hypothetical protein
LFLCRPAVADVAQVARLSTLGSGGILRSRFPVAAKIALLIAGKIADVPVSPIPTGGSLLWTM